MPDYHLLIPETQWRSLRRGYRMVRAFGRSLRVVWREFRMPIVVFLVAVFAGGWMYEQIYNHLSDDPNDVKYYIDMPYQMVSLMIFASPDELPTEWQLVIFWYTMPLIFAYVAGRGVLDFVNLFFVSNERHKSWEEALASTYNNHVIVLGIGHLGTRVVRQLVAMGFDVVAIDITERTGKTTELDQLGVPLVVGDGRLEITMEKAGIRKARALVVCTSNDQMNLEVTMRANLMNADLAVVVRMWDQTFSEVIRDRLGARAVLSATNLAAPSFAAAALGFEITQSMTINGRDYSMIRLEVAPESAMAGRTIGDLQREEDIDIVLHGRRGTPGEDGNCIDDDDDNECIDVHPASDVIVRPGDTLVLFALHSKVSAIVSRNHGGAVRAV